MTISRSVVLAELRNYALRCEMDAQRARVVATEAWAQWHQALDDEVEDTLLVGQQLWDDRMARSRARLQETIRGPR